MDDEKSAAPEHRRRGIAWTAVLLAGIALGAAGMHLVHRHGGDHGAPVAAAQQKPIYQCPMHPAVTSDHPDDCPICGMKLVPVAPSAASDAKSDTKNDGKKTEHKVLFFRSPMDPKQTSPVPRKDEMGMDYVPVYADEGQGENAVAGRAAVSIDPARQQIIGLRTVPATKGAVSATWRTPARVQVDPTRVRQINVKVDGFIEKIYVDFVGQSVRKGQPLFSVYSPSLLAAQNEYLLAQETSESLAKGGVVDNGASLVAAARRRLELWDVPGAEIDRLAQTRKPEKSLTLVSPISGVVTAKTVVQGARVSPGEAPYEITDLGTVWVLADAYETDLARIRVGMKAALNLPAYPDRSFTGKVAFIDPLLDPKTRTAKVHLHFSNRTGELKPEMFGDVVLQGPAQIGLRIPVDAVLRAGNRDVVFVSRGEGRFEPRAVELGAKSGDEVEVKSGLAEGEPVITRANFLVDSESQLRAALQTLGAK